MIDLITFQSQLWWYSVHRKRQLRHRIPVFLPVQNFICKKRKHSGQGHGWWYVNPENIWDVTSRWNNISKQWENSEWVQNAFKNKRQKKDWNKEKFQINNYEHSKIYNIRLMKIQYKSRVYTRRWIIPMICDFWALSTDRQCWLVNWHCSANQNQVS